MLKIILAKNQYGARIKENSVHSFVFTHTNLLIFFPSNESQMNNKTKYIRRYDGNHFSLQ